MLLMTEKNVLLGQKWVIALIVMLAIPTLASLIMDMFNGRGFTAFVRTALSIGLFWELYNGKVWAKWLTIILCVATGCMLFAIGFPLFSVNNRAWVFLASGIFCFAAVAILVLVKPVSDSIAWMKSPSY